MPDNTKENEQRGEVPRMPIWDMREPPEYPEPQVFCGSCWYYDEIANSRFEVVMYCHCHEEAYEDYEACDWYENAARIATRGRL